MGIRIREESKNGISPFINDRGAKLFSQDVAPPKIDNPILPWSAFFENAGSNNLAIDGSAGIEFSISASPQNIDTYISSIIFQIVDTSMDFSKFGGITALTNGCEFIYRYAAGQVTIQSSIQSNFDITRLTGDNQAEIISTFKGSDNGFAPKLIPKKSYGFIYGFKLEGTKSQSLIFKINDNLSALSEFNIFATGFQIPV